MANLGIPYIGQTDPLSRVSSYVDCQTQQLLYPASLTTGTALPTGQQYGYYHVNVASLGGQNIESGWNYFLFQPGSLTCTTDLTNNFVAVPGDDPSSPTFAASAIIAPYDSIVTVFATCLVGQTYYPGKSGDSATTYDTVIASSTNMLIGKNFNITNSVTGLTDGNDQTVTGSTGKTIQIPVQARAVSGSPNTLACTTVANSTTVARQILTVFTSALVQAGDQISISLFVQPNDYEDNYNLRQSVSNYTCQLGFTRATEPESAAALYSAMNPTKPTPLAGAVTCS